MPPTLQCDPHPQLQPAWHVDHSVPRGRDGHVELQRTLLCSVCGCTRRYGRAQATGLRTGGSGHGAQVRGSGQGGLSSRGAQILDITIYMTNHTITEHHVITWLIIWFASPTPSCYSLPCTHSCLPATACHALTPAPLLQPAMHSHLPLCYSLPCTHSGLLAAAA